MENYTGFMSFTGTIEPGFQLHTIKMAKSMGKAPEHLTEQIPNAKPHDKQRETR